MKRAESVPAYNLTEADFQRHPVWRFELDSEYNPETDGFDEFERCPECGAKESIQLTEAM